MSTLIPRDVRCTYGIPEEYHQINWFCPWLEFLRTFKRVDLEKEVLAMANRATTASADRDPHNPRCNLLQFPAKLENISSRPRSTCRVNSRSLIAARLLVIRHRRLASLGRHGPRLGPHYPDLNPLRLVWKNSNLEWRSAARRLSNLMRQVTVEHHQQGVAGNCENSQQQSDGHDRINLAKINCAG
jgi:hypothetical protein